MTSNNPSHLKDESGKPKEQASSPWLRPQGEQSDVVEFRQEHQNVPLSKEEVEDEVIEAMNEVKESVTQTPAESLKVEEKVEAKVEPKVEKTRFQRLQDNRVLVNNLRQQDDAHNRTCALCLRRKPIDDFLRLKTSQVCKDCEE